MPVIEADDQFHLHRYFPAHAFDDADDVRILPSRRHEIDQAHRATFRFQFCFQNERLVTITATHRGYLLIWKKPPVPIFLVAEQGSKTGAGIEPRKTKPIHATVATHQRACLRVTEKPVVLDLCMFLRHLLLPPRERLPRRSFAKAGSETSPPWPWRRRVLCGGSRVGCIRQPGDPIAR